jgi:hypothetical protein
VPNYVFEECCNTHDICYDSCNSVKSSCDSVFRACMSQRCAEVERPGRGRALVLLTLGVLARVLSDCRAWSESYFTAVHTQGCSAYLAAQRTACICDRVDL